MKQAIIAVLAIVVIIGAAVTLGKKDDQTTGSTPSNNVYGNEQAAVTIVEYADFECPGCGSIHPIVTAIKEEFKDRVKFEFRHFPLVQIHANATAAHRAAEAAAKQGKFWEMHDKLYENQATWKQSNSASGIFEDYAQEIGLDAEQFKTDVAASSTLATINADVALGKDDNVDSTPTFFINGKKVEDTASIATVEKFRKVVQEALGENTATTQTAEEATAEETQPTEQ